MIYLLARAQLVAGIDDSDWDESSVAVTSVLFLGCAFLFRLCLVGAQPAPTAEVSANGDTA